MDDREELHNLQLAAITSAALGNTLESVSHRIDRNNPYWTVAYSDVCDVVDREIKLRDAVTTALAFISLGEKYRQSNQDAVEEELRESLK